jgi:hypothetical protein
MKATIKGLVFLHRIRKVPRSNLDSKTDHSFLGIFAVSVRHARQMQRHYHLLGHESVLSHSFRLIIYQLLIYPLKTTGKYKVILKNHIFTVEFYQAAYKN